MKIKQFFQKTFSNQVLHIAENILKDMINIYFQSIVKNEIINDKENYFCYNPTLNLSAAVGGADADLYLIKPKGNFLIDLKTTIKPKITEEMLFQLIGYAFLDQDNEHNIKEIGVYLTRQNLISNWNLSELISKNSKFSKYSEAQEKFINAVYDNLSNSLFKYKK